MNKTSRVMSWPELLGVPGHVIELLNRFVDIRIDYLPALAASILRLRILLTAIGASAEFWPLVSGQPTQTRAANDALHQVAEQIRQTPDWLAAFTTMRVEDLVAVVWTADAFSPLRARIRGWLDAYGHRETISAALISGPTWAGDPQLLLGTLRGLVTGPDGTPSDDRRTLAEQRIHARRVVRLTHSAGAIDRAAAAAGAGMAFREDSHFHALRVRPILRRAVDECGDRLTQAGALAAPGDIFHLRLAELQVLGEPSGLDREQRAQLAADGPGTRRPACRVRRSPAHLAGHTVSRCTASCPQRLDRGVTRWRRPGRRVRYGSSARPASSIDCSPATCLSAPTPTRAGRRCSNARRPW